MRTWVAAALGVVFAMIAGCTPHCDTPSPPPNVHLTTLDASTGAPVVASATVASQAGTWGGCSSVIDMVVVGSHTVVVSANGYLPYTLQIDGGSTVKDCGLWPSHDVTVTVELIPGASQDGGVGCDGMQTHD